MEGNPNALSGKPNQGKPYKGETKLGGKNKGQPITVKLN